MKRGSNYVCRLESARESKSSSTSLSRASTLAIFFHICAARSSEGRVSDYSPLFIIFLSMTRPWMRDLKLFTLSSHGQILSCGLWKIIFFSLCVKRRQNQSELIFSKWCATASANYSRDLVYISSFSNKILSLRMQWISNKWIKFTNAFKKISNEIETSQQSSWQMNHTGQ